MNKGRDTLGHRLISINVYRCDSAFPDANKDALERFRAQLGPPMTIRVLPSMTMRVFRIKLLKTLKIPPLAGRIDVPHPRAWLVMDESALSELDLEQDSRDLAWWGIQNESEVFVYPGQWNQTFD